MSKPKKNLMPMLQHLNQRADNYFAYDKQEQCYVIAQTWHVRVHKTGDPIDKYEVIYFRAAKRFDVEPTEDDIIAFGKESEAGVKAHMEAGVWAGGTADGATDEPFTFDVWKIKDHREA